RHGIGDHQQGQRRTAHPAREEADQVAGGSDARVVTRAAAQEIAPPLSAKLRQTSMQTATTNLLELEHVSKSFDHVRALQDVNITVGVDEIVGLLGDNGAGKSTLIKIITGFHAPDTGTIRWKGEEIHHLSVQRARELGIETVYQERALADQQSLWRNIFMGRERTGRIGLLDLRGMRSETEKLMLEFLRFTSEAVTPDSFVGTMSG